ncbi:ferredoxin [Jatrophihabitans sp.]|uniref:ferredoxin n=1 Tax=Jatrophihabitans sp. TaxID=1932789 RepID=UPI002D17DBD9|nr:ferredoxin [Jatrophihabitans sp.]
MTARMTLDPTACRGVGMCAYAAPELLRLDSWGYPILPRTLEDEETTGARRAARACPHRALSVREAATG